MATYFTLLPWDKVQIVQEVPENYFDNCTDSVQQDEA